MPFLCFGKSIQDAHKAVIARQRSEVDTPVQTYLNEPCYFSLIDGTALIWIPARDISGYKGTEGTSTPYRIEIKDAEGDKIAGFLGNEGTGEALGSELLTNGDFATGDFTGWDTTANWSVVSNAANHDSATTAALGQNKNCYKKLVKLQYNLTNCSAVGVKDRCCGVNWGNYSCVTGIKTRYACQAGDSVKSNGCQAASTSNGVIVDDFTLKQVTEGPALYSLFVVSTNGGSTRNWTTIEVNFNYVKDPQNYNIYIYEN